MLRHKIESYPIRHANQLNSIKSFFFTCLFVAFSMFRDPSYFSRLFLWLNYESRRFIRTPSNVSLLLPQSLVPGPPLHQWPQRGCHQFYLIYTSSGLKGCWVRWARATLMFLSILSFQVCDFPAAMGVDIDLSPWTVGLACAQDLIKVANRGRFMYAAFFLQ